MGNEPFTTIWINHSSVQPNANGGVLFSIIPVFMSGWYIDRAWVMHNPFVMMIELEGGEVKKIERKCKDGLRKIVPVNNN